MIFALVWTGVGCLLLGRLHYHNLYYMFRV